MKHESITLTLYTDPERCTTNYVALQMERHTLQTDNIMMTWCHDDMMPRPKATRMRN